MNIKKIYRLNTKEIKYITNTKRKKFLRWNILNINIIDQYPDKKYNKFWISISSKFHKKAVFRNIIRRNYFDIIYKNKYHTKSIKWKFKKIYVSLKKGVEYNVKWKDFKKKVELDLKKDLDKIFK